MPIITISLNNEFLKDLNEIQKRLGFSGRSEMIRAAVRMLDNEYRQKEGLFGNIEGVIIVEHDENAEDNVTTIKHKFNDVITSHLHTHLRNEKCLEIFVVNGNGEKIKELFHMFQTNKNINHVKLIVV